MKLYYVEGLPVRTKSSSITNFSNRVEIEVEFDPTDLFIELATESYDDPLTYVQNFIDQLGSFKLEAKTLIELKMKYWLNNSGDSINEKLAKKGAIIVNKFIDKIELK